MILEHARCWPGGSAPCAVKNEAATLTLTETLPRRMRNERGGQKMENKLTRVRPENERGSASRCPGRAGCNHNGGADDDDGMRDRWSMTTVTLRPHTKTSPNKPSEAPPLSSFLKRDPAGSAFQDQESFARSICPAEKRGPLYQIFSLMRRLGRVLHRKRRSLSFRRISYQSRATDSQTQTLGRFRVAVSA